MGTSSWCWGPVSLLRHWEARIHPTRATTECIRFIRVSVDSWTAVYCTPGLGLPWKTIQTPLTQQTHPFRTRFDALLKSTLSVQNYPTRQDARRHFAVITRALRSCFAGSACGWKLCRLGIPPQARKPYGSPSYHGRFHSNYPSNLPSLPTDSTPHSIPTLESTTWNIYVIRTVFPRANLKPILSQLSRIWRSERTINRP